MCWLVAGFFLGISEARLISVMNKHVLGTRATPKPLKTSELGVKRPTTGRLWQLVQANRHEEALEIAQHAVQSADAVLEQLEAMALHCFEW